MNNTPKWLRDYWQKHPVIKCERWEENNCSGRLTKEHVFIYAGKQIQEIWACIDLCWYHHLGSGLDKIYNQYIALNRMSEEQIDEIIKKYPRRNWKQEIEYLKNEYGKET